MTIDLTVFGQGLGIVAIGLVCGLASGFILRVLKEVGR